MKNRKLLLAAFILVALVQLYVPSKLILEQEEVLAKGKEFRFKTAPVDPSDPFRGKYITLRYEATRFDVPNAKDWHAGENVYVVFTKDANGFAKIAQVLRTEPANNLSYLHSTISFINTFKTNQLVFDYPFDRFYMEEFKAAPAETAYGESQVDSTSVTCALVMLHKGEAVLKDVLIDAVPIREVVEKKPGAEKNTKSGTF